MSTFAVDLRKFRVKTEKEITNVLRKVALELFQRVVLRTPVDTGRARGNWQVAIGTPSSGVIDQFDTSGGQTINAGQSKIMGWDGDGAIFLFNNLPYIMRLEDGYSGQAPRGMVRLTVQEYPGIVRTEVR